MANKNIVDHVRRTRFIAVSSILFSCTLTIALLGTAGLVASLVFMPVMLSLASNGASLRQRLSQSGRTDTRGFMSAALDQHLGRVGHPSVALVVELDGFTKYEEMHDQPALDGVLNFAQSVIEAHLSDDDVVVRLEGACFGAALAPNSAFDIEAMLNTCTRIQQSLNLGQPFGSIPSRLTASIGFAASSKLKKPTGEDVLQAALTALCEARQKGPGAVRSFSEALATRRANRLSLGHEAAAALDRGDIIPYFQPQISLVDGRLAGVETLTRWHHPKQGVMSPADFLPVLEQAGLMGRLGDTMIKHALQALNTWDEQGLTVPRIGVNLSTTELRDPHLVDRIAMLLDASDIAPDRLVIEVLETVIADGRDDDIISNLAALTDLGCGVDLDDFGTGYASITSIRQFRIERIKIDRSFVAGLDRDQDQKSMVAAILTMADRLGVEALAEGVETHKEMEALKSLGCHTAQGFAFGRPMPLNETATWIENHAQDAAPAVPLPSGRRRKAS